MTIETDVEITTADGICNAAFFSPVSGAHPGVLIWSDAFGLRAAMRELGARLAGDGYCVLIPNPFYRVARAPFTTAANFDFQKPDDLAKIRPLIGSVIPAGNAERDTAAFVSFLDTQAQVDLSKKIGVHGYCLGGPLTLRSAAHLPERIGACASFHGGSLVTDRPDSPHMLASKIAARTYFAIAANDDEKQPDAKDKLQEAFAAAKVPVETEVYTDALHGWCVPDMSVYNRPAAERAWGKLLALYRQAVA